MSFAQKFLITLGTVLAILLALALFGYLTGRWNDDADAQEMPPSKYDQRLLALDREAIDNAYRSKVEALFTTWLSDPSGQPARAISGVQRARRAYVAAMVEIDKREIK